MKIQPEEVKRDEKGYWWHSAANQLGDDEYIPYSWFSDRGLSLKIVTFEDDASEDLNDRYFNGDDVSDWNPTKPDGDGWFVFSIHDTEDGPCCAWVRQTVQERKS
jgi:hypothetical protein